jgi:AcrR family transcriptional regulator
MIGEKGYEQTTLRDIADKAGVSPGLLYKYFASKQAVVLALYQDLSAEFANKAATMPAGRWRERFSFALRTSMDVLTPHRSTLTALSSVLISGGENGLFSEQTAFSRERVMKIFLEAVTGSSDAPGKLAVPLGRLLYLLHLGVILWWLLDRSPKQRATDGLIALLERTLPPLALAMRLPWMKALVLGMDELLYEGLFQSLAESGRRT